MPSVDLQDWMVAGTAIYNHCDNPKPSHALKNAFLNVTFSRSTRKIIMGSKQLQMLAEEFPRFGSDFVVELVTRKVKNLY